MRPYILIWVAKISSSFFFLITPNSLYINLEIFFCFDTSFSLAKIDFSDIRLSQSNSWKISGKILRILQKADIIIGLFWILYLIEWILSMVFFEEKQLIKIV